MTTVSAVRFNLSDVSAGTVAINTLGFVANDKAVFGVIGEEMIVFRVPA